MTAPRWRIALWLTLLLLVLYFAYGARGALLPFAVGALLAYAFAPIVDQLAEFVPARSHRGDVYRRGFAVILLYLAIAIIGFFSVVAFIPVAADQVSQFGETLPETVDAAREQANIWLEEYRARVPADLQGQVDLALENAGNTAADAATSMARRTVSLLTGTLTVVVGFAVMPFWMFYAMRDRHFVRRNFLGALPGPVRDDAINVLHIGDRLLGRYIRAQLILGLIVGTAVGVALTLLNVQLSLALGVIAGVTELIPILGPWIGAIPGLLIVAATEPDKIIWVALIYFLVQQVENLFLVPRIQGEALEMHPAMILLVLSLGGALFGLIGLIVAVPVSALLRELFWYADRRLRGEPPEEALAASHVGRIADVEAELSHRDQLRPEPLSSTLAQPADPTAGVLFGPPHGTPGGGRFTPHETLASRDGDREVPGSTDDPDDPAGEPDSEPHPIDR